MGIKFSLKKAMGAIFIVILSFISFKMLSVVFIKIYSETIGAGDEDLLIERLQSIDMVDKVKVPDAVIRISDFEFNAPVKYEVELTLNDGTVLVLRDINSNLKFCKNGGIRKIAGEYVLTKEMNYIDFLFLKKSSLETSSYVSMADFANYTGIHCASVYDLLENYEKIIEAVQNFPKNHLCTKEYFEQHSVNDNSKNFVLTRF